MPKPKRLAVPWSLEKKKAKFITAPRGAHKKDESMPLQAVMRDILKFGDTAKEVKSVIK